MAITTSSIRPRATVEAGTKPTIYNVPVLLANTEISQALSSNTKRFTIKVRGIAKMQLAFTIAESDTKFITVHPGAAYSEDGLDFNGTLFFRLNRANQTVEIVEWI